MSDSNARLALLFNRYYSGIASEAEVRELMKIIETSDNDAHVAQLMKEHWEGLQEDEKQFSQMQSDALFTSITGSHDHERMRSGAKIFRLEHMGWLRYAAAVAIILLGAGLLWKFKSSRNVPHISAASPAIKDIPAGGNKAILTLSDGSKIVLDSAGNGLLARQGSTEIRKTQSGQLVYDHKNSTDDQLASRINTVSTPKGGTYQIVLPDGSKAWLNAASSIRFPAAFEKNERKVTISGEVYFEVEKDHLRPFKVAFDDAEVQVFGTSFNIMAYRDEASSYTTLVEGSIALKNGDHNKRLTPGQQAAILPDGKLKTEEVDVNEATAWKNGVFFFKDAGVETVMKQVARWYDVEISYEGTIPPRQFTGKVSRNVNISELMGMLSYTGVKCRLEGRKVIISP